MPGSHLVRTSSTHTVLRGQEISFDTQRYAQIVEFLSMHVCHGNSADNIVEGDGMFPSEVTLLGAFQALHPDNPVRVSTIRTVAHAAFDLDVLHQHADVQRCARTQSKCGKSVREKVFPIVRWKNVAALKSAIVHAYH